MCYHYYYTYPTCRHESGEFYEPCEAVTQQGGQLCDLQPDSEPEAVACDQPCSECREPMQSSSERGRAELSTIFEGGESQVGSQLRTTRPNASVRSAASDARRSHAENNHHAKQPPQDAPDAYRWPLRDDVYDDSGTAAESQSATPDLPSGSMQERREAELEALKIEAALRASMSTANIDEAQMVEFAKQLSLEQAPVHPHLVEQTQYAKQMRLPEDEDSFLHEAKKESIRTLTEHHLREYGLRHAAVGSTNLPNPRSANSSNEAGPSRGAPPPQVCTNIPQTGAH